MVEFFQGVFTYNSRANSVIEVISGTVQHGI